MWVIDKYFEFDYGHRVHTQKLKEDFSLDNRCVCRHLHGHRGKIHIFLEGKELDDTGMVTDFKHLNWFKKFIDDVLDHKMILDWKDPLLSTIIPLEYQNSNIWVESELGYSILPPNFYEIEPEEVKEYLEGIVLVGFVPTSENLSQWLFQIAKKKMAEIGVTVSRIEFNETPKSRSTYYE